MSNSTTEIVVSQVSYYHYRQHRAISGVQTFQAVSFAIEIPSRSLTASWPQGTEVPTQAKIDLGLLKQTSFMIHYSDLASGDRFGPLVRNGVTQQLNVIATS
jgi:hypothetical protein